MVVVVVVVVVVASSIARSNTSASNKHDDRRDGKTNARDSTRLTPRWLHPVLVAHYQLSSSMIVVLSHIYQRANLNAGG